MVNESLTAELERYKERVAIFEQRLHVDLNKREKLIDSQMDELIRNRNAKLAAFQQEIDTLKETRFNHVKEKECLVKTLTVFKTESKEKESKYIDKEILNKKKEDFGKRFVTQKEFSAEQAFLLKHLSFFETPVTSHTPVRIEAPSELHKLSIDNAQLLKQIMSQEIVHTDVNSVDSLDVKKSCVNDCNKCLELETEPLKKKDLIEKDVYDKLLKSYQHSKSITFL
ncbi:hypothetical protein Tco_1048404 [Tanacetum coccineum]